MLAAFVLGAAALAQTTQIPVTVRHEGAPVAGAVITCAEARAVADATGRATIPVPPAGCALVVTADGLAPFSTPLSSNSPPLLVEMVESLEVEEEVVVSATRSGRLLTDQVTRVEVVNREEIEEKLLMTPGDIVMLLNETSGIRLQPTAPALGASTVRVQGMPGRFTAVLTDGLPINGTQVASLGLLQIPPMDLQQVEVIKGAASALYGPSALGGVINLVTRRPTESHVKEGLFNITSRSGADAVLWASGPAARQWGYTSLVSVNGQDAVDVDDDRWADLPRYRRLVVRPKLTFASDTAGSLDLTGGLTVERRRGGMLDDPAGRQAVDTTRRDAGAVWRRPVGEGVAVARGAVSVLSHTHVFGDHRSDDRHVFGMSEVSFSRGAGSHLLVGGAAVEVQTYRTSRSRVYAWTTPGIFIQDDMTWSRLSVSLSARLDVHPDFGLLWSPRASARTEARGWDIRLSAGRGAFAPTMFVDEVEEVGAHHVGANRIDRAETAETWSVDIGRSVGPVALSATAFGSRIHNPVMVSVRTDRGTRLEVANRTGRNSSIRIVGAELFARVRSGPWVATAAHTWVRATESAGNERRQDLAFTPERTFSLVAAWEQHGRARVGLEVYYTGRQRLEDNPYRTTSAPYTIVGLLAERRIGPVRVFLNGENLTDVRQSNYDPLLRPAPTVFGQRVVSAWAPLEGRTFNGGFRISF